jgi:hypothetical protein
MFVASGFSRSDVRGIPALSQYLPAFSFSKNEGRRGAALTKQMNESPYF